MKHLNEYLRDAGVDYALIKSSKKWGFNDSSAIYILGTGDPVQVLKDQVNTILAEQDISLSEAAYFSSIDDDGYIKLDIDGMKLEWSFCRKWSYLWEVVKL